LDKLRGIVERITYSNKENGYSVLKIRCKGYLKLVTIVGNVSSANIGSVLTVEGKWISDSKFGRQFKVETWTESLPASIYGIEKYLGSGLINGIGPKYAKLIVNTFGEETINIIENEPERLAEVQKLGQKRIKSIKSAWREHRNIKNIMIFLQEHGISTSFGHKIYKEYKQESIEKIKENPYRLADEVNGIGFKTSDIIAMKLGINKESYYRCRAGIFYILNHFADTEGHCYLPIDELVSKSAKMLEIEDCKIVMTISHLLQQKELLNEDEDEDKIYLPPFFFSEIGVSKKIFEILSRKIDCKICVDDDINKLRENNINYDDIQLTAIKLAIESKFSVITGGPGTGKTTITKAIIDIFKNNDKKVLLCAPTGRGAKKMSETCEIPAKTIHRLLEGKSKQGFSKNENNLLNGDVLIIDEASMIDLVLMYNLLKAVPNEMTVILIGDVDQLPSIGAGNVLRDIINSKVIPVVRLTQVYRQAQNSRIIMNAHKINKGEMPELLSKGLIDFYFIESNSTENTVELISKLCSKRIPKYYKVNPIRDIQIITPIRRGEIGTENLNQVLQSVLNNNTKMLKSSGSEYRISDKVMQIKNNYEKDVFNGDIGFVSDINTDENKLTVNFDEKYVDYNILELEELVLSYAITIHKSQGGEFPIVLMPVSMSHKIMLQRNLLYTGITRAKRLVILIGDKNAIRYAVDNHSSTERYTLLSQRLRDRMISLNRLLSKPR